MTTYIHLDTDGISTDDDYLDEPDTLEDRIEEMLTTINELKSERTFHAHQLFELHHYTPKQFKLQHAMTLLDGIVQDLHDIQDTERLLSLFESHLFYGFIPYLSQQTINLLEEYGLCIFQAKKPKVLTQNEAMALIEKEYDLLNAGVPFTITSVDAKDYLNVLKAHKTHELKHKHQYLPFVALKIFSTTRDYPLVYSMCSMFISAEPVGTLRWKEMKHLMLIAQHASMKQQEHLMMQELKSLYETHNFEPAAYTLNSWS